MQIVLRCTWELRRTRSASAANSGRLQAAGVALVGRVTECYLIGCLVCFELHVLRSASQPPVGGRMCAACRMFLAAHADYVSRLAHPENVARRPGATTQPIAPNR